MGHKVMSFEDDMIEYGFSDKNDYMDYLMDEDDRRMQKQEEFDRHAEEYETWLENLSDEERSELIEEKENETYGHQTIIERRLVYRNGSYRLRRAEDVEKLQKHSVLRTERRNVARKLTGCFR